MHSLYHSPTITFNALCSLFPLSLPPTSPTKSDNPAFIPPTTSDSSIVHNFFTLCLLLYCSPALILSLYSPYLGGEAAISYALHTNDGQNCLVVVSYSYSRMFLIFQVRANYFLETHLKLSVYTQDRLPPQGVLSKAHEWINYL